MAVDLENERAITVVPTSSVVISQKDLDIYRQHFCKEATPAEWTIFKQKCALYGLNPMLNEIHLVARWYQGKQVYSTQVSITGLITLAERTGRYEGTSRVTYYDEELNEYPVWPISKGPYPYAVSIGVYKKGHREPYVATLCFHERVAYKKDKELMPQWKTQGIHMLVKCTLAAALRWEFAEACSGVYIHEEMHMVDAQADAVRVIPDVPENGNEALRATASGATTQVRMATDQQWLSINRLLGQLERTLDDKTREEMTFDKAKELIANLSKAVREKRNAEQTNDKTTKPTEEKPAPNGNAPRPVSLNALKAVANQHYPNGWDALVKTIVEKFKLLDVSDELIANEYNIDAQQIVRDAMKKQPVGAGATSGK